MEPTYKGEALLLRWGETSTAGRTVTFIIEEDAPLHAFKGFPVGKDGQRFALVAVPIGNDQQPEGMKGGDAQMTGPSGATPHRQVAGGAVKPKKYWNELSRAQQAGILSNDKRFWGFSRSTNEEEAAEYIRLSCGVRSRAELDSDPMAADRFDDVVIEYRQRTGLDPEVRG